MNSPKINRHTLWFSILAILGIAVGIVAWSAWPAWQRMTAPAASAVQPEEKLAASAAADVIVVDDKQIQEIATDVVHESSVAVDRKATGRIGFNEDRMTP